MPKSGERKPNAESGMVAVRQSPTTRRFVEEVAATAASRSRVSRASSSSSQSARLQRLIDELGNNRVAKLLSVSASQPSRWRSGEEGMSAENQRKVIDLDYVFGRLEQLFTARQAEIWLTSFNAHLGARPVDVLRTRGAAPVIEAIDAEAQGAFA